MFSLSRSNRPDFMEKQRFGKYNMAEHLNRIFWSSLILLKILIPSLNSEGVFSTALLIASIHLIFSIVILSWHEIGEFLFFSYPLIVALIDVLYMTAIIPYTGLLDSHIYLLYIFPITFWGLRYGIRGAFTVNSIISILYMLVIYANMGSFPFSILIRIIFFLCYSLYIGFFCEKTQNKIYNMATQDGLTSLFNRQYFYDSLNFILEQAVENESPVSLALLDLDNFKDYNDILGHLKGDQLLRKVSALIKKNIRSSDTAARYGGDEFVIIFPDTDSNTAIQIAERIRLSIEEELDTPSDKPLSISIGIAAFPQDGKTPFELFNAADKSLYQAKSQGKNLVVY